MKITNSTLVGLLNTLNSFSEKRYTQKINYAITKNIFNLKKEYQIYEEQLKKLVEKYKDKQVKGKDGKPKMQKNGLPVIKESSRQDFDNEMTELLNFTVDIDFYYIDAESFDYEDANGRYDVMSANEIILLQSILCEPANKSDDNSDDDDEDNEE